ncbi:alpha-hydroxy-acid oxidizing protein [Desulfoplanes formicivorans]|uniref:(S)-2-hydroxy-acid oxidase n=1 Tax=Desulfoplanes formicivorans TaxID=1592317 RepID=A0A194AF30_9BACT|nr:alpha-hydroxy-acid oxidizing protein [Desulfoplanes formicivorans]GAU07389.1 (S)-2-hydroxy-acid oxidase [Desulfoplanes formicivorans]
MQEIRQTARERMKGYCRVCPVCDGRACVGEVPGMGGLGTAASFRDNVSALAERKLNMRLVHHVIDPDTSVEICGRTLDMPVLAAPIGGVSFNMGGKVTEEAYIHGVLEGCVEHGTLGCTGDGVPAFISEAGFAAISRLGGAGIPFVKPWEDAELFDKLDKALASGARIVGMDIDAAGLITLRKMGRPVSPKPVTKLAEIIKRCPVPFLVKGIMTPDDAKRVRDAGAAGIVVSNHGGRVLDHTPGTARVLPRVAQAVRGDMAVLVDGGVRTGTDVLKMLALGADAVMIGRPIAVAAVGGLKEGVEAYLDQVRSELVQAMVLTGTARARAVEPDILFDREK